MNITKLLIAPDMLRVQAVVASPQGIMLKAISTTTRTLCPTCQHQTRRVHSHYVRRVANLPWLGTAMRIEVRVRRLFSRKVILKVAG